VLQIARHRFNIYKSSYIACVKLRDEPC